MEEIVTIRLPGETRQMLNRTPEEIDREVCLYAALMLYSSGKLSSRGAAAMDGGGPRVMFLDLCSEHKIPVLQLAPDELRRELGGDWTRA